MTKKEYLTEEDEADEIIRRLSIPTKITQPPQAIWTIDGLKDLSIDYGLDLDKELLKCLKKK